MNAYIADQIAREHANRLMAEAAAARQAHRARKSRRGGESGHPAGSTAGSAHFVTRPFVAVRSWILAGQL